MPTLSILDDLSLVEWILCGIMASFAQKHTKQAMKGENKQRWNMLNVLRFGCHFLCSEAIEEISISTKAQKIAWIIFPEQCLPSCLPASMGKQPRQHNTYQNHYNLSKCFNQKLICNTRQRLLIPLASAIPFNLLFLLLLFIVSTSFLVDIA